VSFIEVAGGDDFQMHSHECEQILIILEGEEHHVIDGKEIIMKAGDVCVHPPNVEHGGHPGPNGYKGIDIFAAPRDSHVELMKAQGTYPDEYGRYIKK
jgi:quercetin dioxygenase-like cupin family protein